MFKYRGCKGEKSPDYNGGFMWMLTFEDGTHDMAKNLSFALKLCRKEYRRAESANHVCR